MCMLIVGFKSWPLGSLTLKPESLWPEDLDSSPGLLVREPFFFGVFLTAGCLSCQFRARGSHNEGIDSPM